MEFWARLRRHEDQLRFVQTRHEEMAAFMACGHAKFTGNVGVCLATSGPGAIHLLNGLYDAKLDHQPVVAIVGQTFVRAIGGDFQQEVKLLQLYSDVASAFCEQVNEPSSVRHLIDRALRIAQAERTVTCVIVPADVQDMEAVTEQPHATHTVHSGVGYWRPRVIPEPSQLQQAADILNAGERVAMLVGQGALEATDEVIAVADALGAGVAKALLGKAAVPDDVPFCTGSIGLLGTKPSWDMMQGADTLLMVGSSFPYSEFLPQTGQVKAVQIDLLGRMLSIRYPMDLALEGDSQETLKELLPLLERKEDRSWQEEIKGNVADWWRLMDEQGEPADRDRAHPSPGAVRSTVAAAARQRDPVQRFGLGRQLVRAADQDSPWDEGDAVGQSGDDGARGALRDRRQVRLPGPRVDRDGGRRGDADGRDGGDADRGQVLQDLGRSSPGRPGAQQRGPQPGHVGTAGDGGRPGVRGLAGDPLPRLRRVRRADRPAGESR